MRPVYVPVQYERSVDFAGSPTPCIRPRERRYNTRDYWEVLSVAIDYEDHESTYQIWKNCHEQHSDNSGACFQRVVSSFFLHRENKTTGNGFGCKDQRNSRQFEVP